MPATVLQSNAGGFNGTSGNATLGSGTTAGTTLLLIIGIGSAGTAPSPNPPTGFTPTSGEGPTAASNKVYFFRKSNVAAGETSWAIGSISANLICWSVLEVDGLDLTTPKDVTPASFSTATAATSVSTGTTPTSTTYDGFAVAAHLSLNATNTTVPTWSGQTGGFTEVTDAGVAGASTAAGMAVATQNTQALATFSSTGTSSVTGNLGATVVVYSAAGAKRAANVQIMAGFEWGTATGMATAGIAGTLIFDAVTGSPAVVSTNPRSGSYCLELSSSAAAENVQWSGTASFGSASNIAVIRFAVLFPSALPGADVDLFGFGGTATSALMLRYRSASQKLGLQVRDVSGAVNGTEQLSANTVSADTWYGIDIRYDGSVTTLYTGDWQVDGVDQTQATVSPTVSAAQAPTGVTLGWVGATTATVRYDDVVVSRTVGHYPLGDMRILPLKPDPAGTPTISGTAANFGVMTANGTIGAWNAANALAAVDDIPPTVGASADGAVAVTASATDFAEFPMETYDAAANGAAVRAVRAYFALWAASTTAATIRLQATDGATAYSIMAESDPNADNAVLVWGAGMIKPTAGWTQTRLDGLALRFGSNDATPDIGVHALLAEVCVRTGWSQTMFGSDASDVQVTASRDPDSAGIISLTTQGADYKGTALTYDVSGTPTNATVKAGANRTDTIGAPDAPTVDYVAIYPDPEGVADA